MSGARIGPYLVIGELGRGGMASVLRVRHATGGAELALKLLHAGSQASPAQRLRFQREVQALAALDHPHVVRVRDVGEERGAPWLVMDLVAGETLQARLERRGPLPLPEAVATVAALARAVAHAHARGVLHRDLKPDNVLLRARDGAPLLTDFGLARVFDAGPTHVQLTATGQVMGSPGYWSPELAAGRLDAVDERTDVYGLGAVLFALLTGEPPGGKTLAEAADVERAPPPPSALRPQVDRALDALVARCLARDPARRFPSAAALAGALDGWSAGQRQAGARHPARVGLFLGVLALLAVALPVAGWLWRRSRGTAQPSPAPVPAPEPAAPAPAEASPPTDATDDLLRARRRIEEGDLAGGIADCTRVLERTPRADGWLLRGAARHRLEDWAGAAEDCTRALELEPDNALALANRAAARLALGDLAGGRADSERALELDPRPPGAWLTRGKARYHQGDPAGAEEDATSALERDPRLVDALDLRAFARVARGERRAALEDLARAIELEPSAHLFAARGVVLIELGEQAAAGEEFTRALALDPTHANSWANRAQTRRARGDLAGAVADATRALELDPRHVVALEARASARLDLGDAAGAIEDCTRQLALVPSDVGAYTRRAMAHRRAGDMAGSVADDSRAIELDPKCITSLINRSDGRLRLGDVAGALADAERVIALDAQHPFGWLNRGEARLAGGDAPGAALDLGRALELFPPQDPMRAEAQRLLGEAQRKAR